jgi:large subunit ribosomal protein L15e
MGLTKYLREFWKKPDPKILRERMIEWRKTGSITPVDKPLRLDRAHALGYKAKKGIVVVRVKLSRGGHKRPRPNKGRRSKRLNIRLNLSMNYKEIAEQRAARKYPNCEVIGSYWIAKDGQNYFYEVILADRNAPTIKADKELNYLTKPANKARIFRGKSSSGRKARGLRNSPVKAPKVRPSLRANHRKGN